MHRAAARPLDRRRRRDLAVQIAREHLQDVADRELTGLQRALDTQSEALQEALALIRGCHPRPGSAFESAQPEYIVPESTCAGPSTAGSRSPASVPRLRVNQAYASVINRSADYASLRGQLQEARWLIRSLEIRNETLLKVARTIVQRQPRSSARRRSDGADDPARRRRSGQHARIDDLARERPASTCTRRAASSSSVILLEPRLGVDGTDVSSVAIRTHPSPDRRRAAGQAAERCAARGDPLEGRVKVARRTVAKYRESLGSPHPARAYAAGRNTGGGNWAPCNRLDRFQSNYGGTAMRVHLSGHHVESPGPAHVRHEETGRIVQRFDRTIDLHCILTVEKLRHKAESTVTMRASRSTPTRSKTTCTPRSTRSRTSSTAACVSARNARRSSRARGAETRPHAGPCEECASSSSATVGLRQERRAQHAGGSRLLLRR